ncbi:MAG: DUF559 domain-containing protein, partial [Paenibacillaceae bacterium]|nr:DUF559 domain-containing protein [Paenibacillaceae bacterium]
ARRDAATAKQAHPWLEHVHSLWQRAQAQPLVAVAQTLIADIRTLAQRRSLFLERPIDAPSELAADAALVDAVQLLAQGKQPFGLFGMLGKKHHKQLLDAVRILGAPPQKPEQWAHVAAYVDWQQTLSSVTMRWTALAPDFGWPVAFPHPFAVFDAAQAVQTIDTITARTRPLIDDARTLFAWNGHDITEKYDTFRNAVQHHVQTTDLARSWETKQQCLSALDGCAGRITERMRICVQTMLGAAHTTEQQWQSEWTSCMDELHRVRAMHAMHEHVNTLCDRIAQAGGIQYARMLKTPGESSLPDDIHAIWNAKRMETELARREGKQPLHDLAQERRRTEEALAEAYRTLIVLRTHLSLALAATPAVRAALQAYRNAINKIGKGTGKRAARYRHDARLASQQATAAIPCWIMPHDRVCESLPAQLGCFDLVIIDEASQSDITALPSLLRAKKVLIVGDDKQVSPDGIGLEEEKMQHIMQRFLHNQVEAYRAQFAPDRSIYDLCKVVFAHSTVMLREHFRCVSPIIEYSKREFYNHELRPLRIPKASERLDPPLIDVYVKDGFRKGDVNIPEAHFIVEEIKRMIADKRYAHRTIGVVSLLGFAQAQYVYQRIVDTIGIEAIERHAIACGDARTFQGKERDVVFLSLVAAAHEKNITAMTRDAYAQRFNVAASRARDQMVLVRSCTPEQLSDKDVLRRGLIAHFAAPFLVDEQYAEEMRTQCASDFERAVYDVLIERGYRVRTQVRVGNYRIDLVVEGNNDERIAIECDGDAFHGPDRWEADIRRQRVLERAGWTFWRCFASTWIRKRRETIDHLIQTLTHHHIHPSTRPRSAPSPNTEHRIVQGTLG